jgi:DNA-binding NarL/FixJ family response regulator
MTTTTTRTDTTLVIHNGFGSTSGVQIDKGTAIAEIEQRIDDVAKHTAANSADALGRERPTLAYLISDKTGKKLRSFSVPRYTIRDNAWEHGLSPRQKEVSEAVKSGLSDQQIAAKMGCSGKTVDRIKGQIAYWRRQQHYATA